MPRSWKTAWKEWRKKDRRLSPDEIPYLQAIVPQRVANAFEVGGLEGNGPREIKAMEEEET